MMPNQKQMNLKLTRGEVCDLMIALAAAKTMCNDEGKKWMTLHEKINQQLKEFDEKNDI